MLVTAKTIFEEKNNRSPWRKKPLESPPWPFLLSLLPIQILPHLDFFIAEKVWKQHPHLSEEAAAFLCHLTMAAKQGHLCVKVEENLIYPSPEHLWGQEAIETTSQDIFQKLTHMIIQGANEIPEALLTNTSSTILKQKPPTPLCRFKNLFYLQKYWIYESHFIFHLQRILKTPPSILFPDDIIQDKVWALLVQGILQPEQADAILNASANSLSLITGGPGTGKSFTAGQLVKTYWEALPIEHRQKYEIALAAPTGKAAANLQRSLNAIVSHIPDFKPLSAKTLHSLLNFSNNRSSLDSPTLLSADLILIDESSMIDIQLMASLFESVKEGARLILLGDRFQLPSVEAGGIFSDLIHYTEESKGTGIAFTELRKCMRTDLESILTFAKAVNEGNAEKALSSLQSPKSSREGVFRIHTDDIKEKRRNLIEYIDQAYFKGEPYSDDPQAMMLAFNSTRVLSPLRKGPHGIDGWNELLHTHFKKKAVGRKSFIVPIIITSNDYQQDLYNGETGILVKHPLQHGVACEKDYAIFPSRSGVGERHVPSVLLPKYEYAYCLSVHKSQGSEFDHVILLLPEGADSFGREILYTAATRAKKRLEVWGPDHIIEKVIQKKPLRLSGLHQRMIETHCLY